jgi:hypothetical protein
VHRTVSESNDTLSHVQPPLYERVIILQGKPLPTTAPQGLEPNLPRIWARTYQMVHRLGLLVAECTDSVVAEAMAPDSLRRRVPGVQQLQEEKTTLVQRPYLPMFLGA